MRQVQSSVGPVSSSEHMADELNEDYTNILGHDLVNSRHSRSWRILYTTVILVIHRADLSAAQRLSV